MTCTRAPFFAGDGDHVAANFSPDGHAVNPEEIAIAVIGLHQHAYRPASAAIFHHARRRADAALEVVADHAGAAAHAAFRDRAAVSVVDRRVDVRFGHVVRVRIVEPAIVSFGGNGQGELMRIAFLLRVHA